MTVRTTRTCVTFKAPFQLPGFAELPAGTYAVDTDEEAFEGNVRTVYQRIAMTLRVPTGSGFESHSVQPKDLEQALARDERTKLEAETDSIVADRGDALVPHSAPSRWRWVPLWVRDTRPDGRSSQ